jgi:hypothetical protein
MSPLGGSVSRHLADERGRYEGQREGRVSGPPRRRCRR